MGDSEHGGDHARLERIEAKLDRVLAFLGEPGGGDSLRKVLGDIISTLAEMEQLEVDILDILKASTSPTETVSGKFGTPTKQQ